MNKHDQAEVINKTVAFIQNRLKDDSSGHDWWHIYRVWQAAKYIGQQEAADLFVVELTALLHDIADWKFHDGDVNAGPAAAREWLMQLKVDQRVIDQVCDIISNMSFKGANVTSELKNLEGLVVQDADRLDAIGAIGVARAFAFGGAFSQPMHDPEIPVVLHDTFESYKNKKTTTVNHFYEKLLLLKDRMNTQTAKKMAERRHAVMDEFLKQFFYEWDSKFSSE